MIGNNYDKLEIDSHFLTLRKIFIDLSSTNGVAFMEIVG